MHDSLSTPVPKAGEPALGTGVCKAPNLFRKQQPRLRRPGEMHRVYNRETGAVLRRHDDCCAVDADLKLTAVAEIRRGRDAPRRRPRLAREGEFFRPDGGDDSRPDDEVSTAK